MSHRHLAFAAVSLSLALAGCSDDGETPPMGNTGTSGVSGTASPAAGSAAGAAAGAAAGTAASVAGAAGPSTAGRGTPPLAGAAGAATAGSPAGGAGASAAGTGAAGTPAAGTSGMTGTAGMPVAGQGPTAGGSGEPAPPVSCEGLTGKAGRTMERVENAGVMRDYILYVPSSYKGDAPVPLMVNYHPLLTDAATAERSSGWKAKADSEGFIVAFPNGQESAAWNVGPCCTQSRDVDDVGFSRALVKQIQSKFCVDPKRIYASGFSMGGGMAHVLGCEAADLFAAIAPGHFDLMAENTCAPARPITVISFRSESDVIVPYEGGVKQSAPNGFTGKHTFLGAVPTFEKWAEIDGCTDQPMDTGGGCQTHKQCKAGVEVTLCTVPGGHSFPDVNRSWETVSKYTLP